jgi:stringent starvation protein B
VSDGASVAMNPRRPYLLRALHEWIVDSNCTPHIVVDANQPGVEVPRPYVKDGKIVLNVSMSATSHLQLGNDEVSFSGRFGGMSMHVRVPIGAVLAIYARESGQGMIFSDEDLGPQPSPDAPPPADKPPEPPKPTGSDDRRARFKVVK